MVYSPGLAYQLLLSFPVRLESGEKDVMTQNLAFVIWPLLMVVSAIIPVLLGLREYRRSR